MVINLTTPNYLNSIAHMNAYRQHRAFSICGMADERSWLTDLHNNNQLAIVCMTPRRHAENPYNK